MAFTKGAFDSLIMGALWFAWATQCDSGQRNFDVFLRLGLRSWTGKDEGCGLMEGRPLGSRWRCAPPGSLPAKQDSGKLKLSWNRTKARTRPPFRRARFHYESRF